VQLGHLVVREILAGVAAGLEVLAHRREILAARLDGQADEYARLGALL
jgi:PleD family two-component response regulator